ncbi:MULTISPECIES: DUF2550 family protein [Micrococcaceae]|uniref:DUF2550 domain-containing protein n=2 Tax=Pseudoglutamicibacter albus TaxID=98671 RepID=A0A095YGL2_9MICC|nr:MULTISPECIES: DUF2550 family protein [Micrococcaceae]KGF21378.1 hypothetical protein HMPREF2128_01440 [Pseudoglutamicibacter albus DNF00011]KGF21438.1 hypothetical protein HMPREF2128_01805 [Pseudoglutamicibacter albus DNF00011]MCG7305213.1 DUF2550 domain-containing protein [Pseudoglutamicibacter albus]MDR7293722.1 hypothetical protein [Pseudoglutamicibacter albus]OFT24046.1 hypothetical protein HMPREF3175_01880 [Arthrobacter sp. HMSC08H08]
MSIAQGLLLLGVLVLVLIGAYFVAMRVRRNQLRRTLGTFKGALHNEQERWTRVICRYGDHRLDVLRLFSVSPIPVLKLQRPDIQVLGWEPSETVPGRFPSDWVVVEIKNREQQINLAMSYGDYTGLASWVEAGPVAGMGTWRQSPSN